MDVTKNRLVRTLGKFSISRDVIKCIKDEPDSPLNYAFCALNKEMPESNDLDHSCRVLENCMKIILESGSKITPNGYLLLFCASLLHDVDKSNNAAIKSEVNDVLKEKCELFSSEKSDHGIRSAHYIDKKLKSKESGQRITPYGLDSSEVRRLLNIISFHHSGRLHPCFLPPKLQREELSLCLIFLLADKADASAYRARISQSVSREYRSDKDEARSMVNQTEIKKNVIIWRTDKQCPKLEQAKNMANSELSKHRLLLQASGLPNRIICLQKRKRAPKEDLYVSRNDVISANLCFDVSERPTTPLVLSANTLPELYEKLVEASYKVSVPDELLPQNYFGPVVLEVTDVENDEADKINIRSKTGKNYALIKDYTETWLNPDQEAADKFYFGYTHGQRIWKYIYPCSGDDIDTLLSDRKKFKELTGEINQFNHILEILEKPEARRAYVVIPHLIIDNPESHFYIEEEVAPALIAIQFMIEEDQRLSGFALLRAQELSTFFVVNYLEVKSLVEKLTSALMHKFSNIKAGRIVMLSAFGYFQPNTALLDKPEICQLKPTRYQHYASKLAKSAVRKEFIRLLEEFKKDFIKIETKWCEEIEKYLKETTYAQKGSIIQAIQELKRDLGKVEEERKARGHSITSDIRSKKREAVDKFIETIQRGFE
jgi:hypothetical protein